MLDKVSVSWEQATFKCHLEVVYYALCHQSSSHHNDVRMIIITTVVRQAEKSLKYQSQFFWRAAQLTGMIVNSKARKQEKEGNLAVDRQMLNVCIIFWLTEIELRLPGIFIHSSTAVGTRYSYTGYSWWQEIIANSHSLAVVFNHFRSSRNNHNHHNTRTQKQIPMKIMWLLTMTGLLVYSSQLFSVVCNNNIIERVSKQMNLAYNVVCYSFDDNTKCLSVLNFMHVLS